MSSNHLSPYKVITVLLIVFFVLFITSLWFIYFITGGFYLLILFTYFTHPQLPPLQQPLICSLYLWMYFLGGKAFLLIKGEFPVSLHRKRHLGARGTLNTMFEITIYFHQCLQQCARKTGFRARYFQAVILWASCFTCLHFAFLVKKETRMRTSLVVQWFRIHLPVQGIRVPSLVWEASTCHRATEPMCCNYRSCAPQSPCSAAGEATAMRSTTAREQVLLVTGFPWLLRW